MLVEIKENPFIQIEGNFHMKLQCFREKGGFIDQKGRRSIAGLGSVTPRPIHSPRTFAVAPPPPTMRENVRGGGGGGGVDNECAGGGNGAGGH